MPKVVWAPVTRRHEPKGEVWVGVPTPGTEVPERVDRILEALTGPSYEVIEARHTTIRFSPPSTTRHSCATSRPSTQSGCVPASPSWWDRIA